ncbi:MAG: flavodoxin-dependent (E)-4-hydroxy-3-methylbut-2-enyl-diphosphate synthase, partial [Bacteroidales bacterium]|nr:flavodoxin-dependent (E)-4-hydroxy-3-methylbut-2-enyl-diphosphate synthase [Candidatus Equibacterium intestinale]
SMYGDTPLGMARAVMEWLQVCVDEDFTNVTVSLKASNPRVMIDAYRLLYKTMQEELGMIFPLHLGVTEAGGGVTGRIKSAVGIGTLLRKGIGDTIRVSLTERPENEIPVAQLLASLATSENAYDNHHNLDLEAVSQEEFLVKASWIFGPDLMDRKIDDFELSATVAGHKLSDEEISSFKDDLMQACRRRFTKPEYIACPGCGRTLYNLEKLLKDVMDATSEFAGVKIAVMGCIVNGPGEMADADYGYVGEGGGKVTLYRGREVYARGIDQAEGVARLVELIRSDRN